MKRLSVVVSLPGDNNYLREQASAAKATASRLDLELQVINAKSDPVVQSQQLLEIIQSSSARPDAVLVEPVNNQGLPRVAEAAVAAGVGWIISNARVEYLGELRKSAKAPLFTVSQDHTEIGRMQGKQIAAFLPAGGSILYLRGPATNFLASQRSEGMERALPVNVHVKTLKIQWTEESAYNSVCTWLNLSIVHAADTHLVSSQNTDFILGAKRAFQTHGDAGEQQRWLRLPRTGVGVLSQVKPLLDDGTLAAAVITSLTTDIALEMLVKAFQTGVQPPEHTFVPASSRPALADLVRKYA